MKSLTEPKQLPPAAPPQPLWTDPSPSHVVYSPPQRPTLTHLTLTQLRSRTLPPPDAHPPTHPYPYTTRTPVQYGVANQSKHYEMYRVIRPNRGLAQV